MDWLFGGIIDFFGEVLSLIPKTVYFLCVSAMSILDVMQLVLRKVAGLDVYYIGSSNEANTGDIALSFIRSIFDEDTSFPAIRNAFWALVLLGVILLIVTTIIAIIRQEYMADESGEKSNNKITIVSKSIKSLFLFMIVPVSAIFGLMLSDIFLVALDSATTSTEVGGTLLGNATITNELVSNEVNGQTTYKYYDVFGLGDFPTTTATFSGMVFKTSAYTANRVRIGKTYAVYAGEAKTYYNLILSGDISNFDIFDQATSDSEMAQIIDDAFASNVKLKNPDSLVVGTVASKNFSSSLIWLMTTVKHFSKFNVSLVWYYYDLWQFNFLVAFAFLVVCIKLLAKIVMGLMKRIIELVALFIISPPIVAIMPLDNGKAFGEWRKNFISKALYAYGSIIGMNLFFLILPYLNEIKFFSADAMNLSFLGADTAISMVNLIVTTLFIIAGLVAVEGFIELLSGLIGSESAAKAGGEMIGKVGDTLATSAKYTGAAAGFATKLALAPLSVPIKASGLDKKVAGGIKKMGQKAKRSFAFGGKKGKAAKKEIRKKWNESGAKEAYNSMLDKDEEYSDSMNEAFKNRKTGQNMSFDEWRDKSKEGQKAHDATISSLNSKRDEKSQIQAFDNFKKGIIKDKDGKYKISQAYKDFQTDEMDAKTETWSDAFSARREAIAKSGLKQHTVLNAVGKEALGLGKHMTSYASNFDGLFKQAFEREGKQGLKSMVMAFQGKTQKEIEQAELYTKLKEEESAKAQVNEEMRAKAEAKERIDREKDNKNNSRMKVVENEIKKLKNDKNTKK